jgi:hypothetical protein
MPYRVFYLYFVEKCAIVQLSQERVSNRPLGRIMVFDGEALVFNAVYLGSESINTGISCGFIRTVKYEMGFVRGHRRCLLAF